MSEEPVGINALLTSNALEELVRTGKLERRVCKRCPKKIYFVRNAEGATIPLDAVAPVYRVALDGGGDAVAVRTVAFVSHFATCPAANSFSSSKKGGSDGQG